MTKLKPWRGKIIVLLAALVLSLFCLLLVNNDHLYRQTIVRVTKETTEPLGMVKGENGVSEQSYRQELTGIVQNGSREGAVVSFENDYTKSEVKTTRYRVGDQLFVRFQQSGNQKVTVVLSVKRDAWLVGIFALFVCTLCLFYQGRGFLILASLGINLAMIFATLNFCDVDRFFDRQWPILIVLFCVTTLVLVNGFHRQTLGAILSTLISAALIFFLYQLTVNRSAVVPYDMMADSAGGALPIENIFRFSVIAGSIGAIMDVSVAIHISVEKLVETQGVPDLKSAVISMRKIGADIMGTMINILLFSYVSQTLPIAILKINSGYSVSSIFSYDLIFDFVRFLLGAIGIVLAIPVSEGVALFLCRKGSR